MVGQALKYVQDPSVPWQRVVGSGGVISERGDGGEGAARQAARLADEGVEVIETSLARGARGRWRVGALSVVGWCTCNCSRSSYGVVACTDPARAAKSRSRPRSTVWT